MTSSEPSSSVTGRFAIGSTLLKAWYTGSTAMELSIAVISAIMSVAVGKVWVPSRTPTVPAVQASGASCASHAVMASTEPCGVSTLISGERRQAGEVEALVGRQDRRVLPRRDRAVEDAGDDLRRHDDALEADDVVGEGHRVGEGRDDDGVAGRAAGRLEGVDVRLRRRLVDEGDGRCLPGGHLEHGLLGAHAAEAEPDGVHRAGERLRDGDLGLARLADDLRLGLGGQHVRGQGRGAGRQGQHRRTDERGEDDASDLDGAPRHRPHLHCSVLQCRAGAVRAT